VPDGIGLLLSSSVQHVDFTTNVPFWERARKMGEAVGAAPTGEHFRAGVKKMDDRFLMERIYQELVSLNRLNPV
jgi:hypothetical protein